MIKALKALKKRIDKFLEKANKKTICIECEHCSEPDGIKDYYCYHPERKNVWKDYITGEESSSYDYCMYYNTMGECDLFKPKDEVPK